MGMARRAFLVAAVAVAVYVALQPSPEDVDSAWTVKINTFTMKMGYFGRQLLPTVLNEWLDLRQRAARRETGPGVPYTDEAFDRVPVRVFADHRRGGEAAGVGGLRPGVVYIHGGGWITGNVDNYHGLTSAIARELDAVVVSVDYRLAPKYPFPAAIDDCTAATVWFLTHLGDYGVDPARVALMGDSAGGNLAAAVAQRLTFDPEHRDLPRARLQVLIYPALQAFDLRTPSYQQNGDYSTVVIDRNLMAMAWDLYLRGNKGTSHADTMKTNSHTSRAAKRSPLVQKCLSHDLIPAEFKGRDYRAPSGDAGDPAVYEEVRGVLLNPDFAPLMREELSGLPEAYILTAEYDVLRDDGLLYAKRLEAAAVPVTLRHYRTGYHGMFSVGDQPILSTPISRASVNDFIRFAKANL